ncbi:MAG: ABC transporter ATP-binding protein [Candidatus Moranbacteria bacterium]|nr:ABC transporter ATP-binding protein [Candidatus Moranbacteria bacterium]
MTDIAVPAPGLFGLLRGYKGMIGMLVVLTIVANALSIVLPKIIAGAIDMYTDGNFIVTQFVTQFFVVAILIFIFTYLQNVAQVFASERVARDMRNGIVAKLSVQPYAYIERVTPAKLLTNLTSDVDAVKSFVSVAISSIISSAFLIVAVAVLLVLTDWKLGLSVLAVMPFIAVAMFIILGRVRKLFVKSQEAIDWLNKVIGESILGAALIRLLDSHDTECVKFHEANTEAKRISLRILGLFASLVPIITFFTNIATLTIVLLGGWFVVSGEMTLGSFTAFNSYLAILIFPILIIGFMSNVIAQATASYGRIQDVLNAPVEKKTGGVKATLRGDIEVRNVTVDFEGKSALTDVSFSVKTGSRTAIIGPTAAGKTQLLYLLTGLLVPTTGEILFDGRNLNEYDKESLHGQVGFVFQDSIMFNMSLRENIAFSDTVRDENLGKAIVTAELREYVDSLPRKLDTVVSERGTSLSGGQKQRIMLARALALDPKILLLDDFIARVDADTERRILSNVAREYPDLTLISVTQKISSIEHYDQIIVIMEGELLAKGTHEELMATSPEYVQIYESQRSTSQYE